VSNGDIYNSIAAWGLRPWFFEASSVQKTTGRSYKCPTYVLGYYLPLPRCQRGFVCNRDVYDFIAAWGLGPGVLEASSVGETTRRPYKCPTYVFRHYLPLPECPRGFVCNGDVHDFIAAWGLWTWFLEASSVGETTRRSYKCPTSVFGHYLPLPGCPRGSVCNRDVYNFKAEASSVEKTTGRSHKCPTCVFRNYHSLGVQEAPCATRTSMTL